MWKRGEIAPKEQFLLFSTLFYIYIFLTSGVKLHIHLLNMVVQFIAFLTLSTLICWGTGISKNFSESLGIRDNKSWLYLVIILEYFFLFLYKNIFCGYSVEVLQWVPKSMFKEKWENYRRIIIKYFSLTLKTPRKPASENVICLCRLLIILANFSNLFLHTGKQCGPWSDCS